MNDKQKELWKEINETKNELDKLETKFKHLCFQFVDMMEDE